MEGHAYRWSLASATGTMQTVLTKSIPWSQFSQIMHNYLVNPARHLQDNWILFVQHICVLNFSQWRKRFPCAYTCVNPMSCEQVVGTFLSRK